MSESARVGMIEAELEETYRSVTELTNELSTAKERLERLSLYDDLTGLANRTLYHDRFDLVRAVADRQRQSLLIFLMDLDRFKDVNDILGHEAGDIVLRTVAKRIKWRLRDSDTVARMGGDEFAFLLALGPGAQDPARLVREIVEVVQQPIEIGSTQVDVGVSIGVARYPEDGTDLSVLLGCADKAMYEAKRKGGGFHIHESGMAGRRQGPHFFAGDLRNAIAHNELELYYQPKVDMRTLAFSGLEALVRWRHPDRGLIMPDDFVPLAERSSLIVPFTRKTVALAAEQAVRWQRSGMPHSIAVNLSPRSLHDPALADEIVALIGDSRGLSEHLVFEVTESALMVDPDKAVRTLNRLAALGVSVSIDDFGTGYSSLNCLSSLPVRELKIDRSFVAKMHVHKEDLAIVRSMIDLAHKLDMSVVAEGVESQEDWSRLADFGCDYAQGYYISRPVPPDELAMRCRRWFAQRRAPDPAAIQRQATPLYLPASVR